MHVKYKLRKANGLVTPKGPSFSRAKTIRCDIDGTIIKFKAPKHRESDYSYKPVLPARAYQLDEMFFRSNYSEGFNVSDNWKIFKFFESSWAFNGPWFTGTLANLYMYFDLVKPVNYENEDFSLFHPRAFEKIVGDYLTNQYSTYTNELMGGKHHYIAPVNWQPLSDYPVVAVRLEVRPDLAVTRGKVRYLIFFPITDKVMASILFIPSQLLALSQEELDKRVNRSTMLELMNNIIDSIELTLSPEAQAQQQAALAGIDDTSLIKNHLPLKWPATPQDNKTKSLQKD